MAATTTEIYQMTFGKIDAARKKQLSETVDQLAAANKIIAEQSALIAKCHAALEACVQEFGDENPDDDWDAIVKARAAIALCEGRS